jgi:hypothetical protein
VTVQYAPDKPSESVLEAGSNRHVSAQLRTLVACFIIIVIVNVGPVLPARPRGTAGCAALRRQRAKRSTVIPAAMVR